MRIIGIDLEVTAKHRAIIADDRGHFISPIIKLRTRLPELERLHAQARRGMEPDEPLAVVMEATDIVWYPPPVYFLRQGATVYVVNPRMAADLARFCKRHAKSDRLAAKVLARLPVVSPDSLYPLVLSGADYLALQRGCKELDRLTSQASAIKNRLQSTDHLGWPDLKQRIFSDPFPGQDRQSPCPLVPRSLLRAPAGDRGREGLRLTTSGSRSPGLSTANSIPVGMWRPSEALARTAGRYNQMVNKGKHHNQAVCACATHLLDQVRVILLEDRPYELRDVDGTPVTPQEARQIILERYIVPEEVRRRNNKRARRERAERRAERKERRRNRSR